MNEIKIKRLTGIKKYIGLMFKPRRIAEPIEFIFEKEVMLPIHSYFVFFPFKAIWYDATGCIIEEKIIQPFAGNYYPRKPFIKLVEIPL